MMEKEGKEIPRQSPLRATSQTGLEEEEDLLNGRSKGRQRRTRSVGLIDVGLTISPLGAFNINFS